MRWLGTWPRNWCITWLCRWGPLIRSHHPATFGIHRPCESGIITFSICHVTTILKCHVTLWVVSPNPSILNLVSIHLMELEIMAFIVSVPIPIPIPFPMPTFQCRGLQMACLYCLVWTYFTLCFSVSIVHFELVNPRWVQMDLILLSPNNRNSITI